MVKALNTDVLSSISSQYGNAFYLLESESFKANFLELKKVFESYYSKINIAYSYKTNYTPKLVKIIDHMGGYAEVVSDMELHIAQKAGVKAEHIIWNGPVKNKEKVRNLLLSGGTVNIDSVFEIDWIRRIAEDNPDNIINIGIRCNYDIGDGVISRFGIDVEDESFDTVLRFVVSIPNVHLRCLQAHFAKRNPEYWTARTEGMLKIYDTIVSEYGIKPEFIDLGGGMYGKMSDGLRKQLAIGNIDYDDYASSSAKLFAEHFDNNADAPYLYIEPGSAIAGDSMRFVCRVESIKAVRGRNIATVTGSQKNISMSGINAPMEVIFAGRERRYYSDIDIVGYTCIEGDILYRGFAGDLAIGDYIVFSNCGSYSVVMKPPFILPNVPVIDICGENIEVIKKAETFDDLFKTYSFRDITIN